MANKYIEKMLNILLIRKRQSKATTKYYISPTTVDKINKNAIRNVDENTEQWEPSYLVSITCNLLQPLWKKQFGSVSKG